MKTVAGALLAVGLSIGAAGALAETNSTMQQGENPAQPKAGEQGPPKTVGAMQNAVGDKATSAEDVKRQTEGKPTMAQEAQEGDKATHPKITEHAPGTVGAAPGTTPPSGREAKK
jgi:hypothetical protein